MKILYLVNTLDKASGWGRFSLELIEGFKEAGIEVHIFSEFASSYPGEQPILKRSLRALLTIPKIRRYVKKNNIDVVHSFELNPYAIVANLALVGLKTKHVITATGAYSVRPLYQTRTRFLTKRAYATADKILCISTYIKDEINKVIPINNMQVITLGVNPEKFAGTRVVPAKPFMLSVGNFGPRKGFSTSIEAFGKIALQFPDLEYKIAGRIGPEEHATLTPILEKYDIGDRVDFLGSQSDEELKQLYLSASLFILTSVNIDHHFEGFGLVFLEAAAAGLPVIGTTENGIIDAISDGKNGYLIPQFDTNETANAIRKILENEVLAEKFGKASSEFAKQNTWKRAVENYMEVYEQLTE